MVKETQSRGAYNLPPAGRDVDDLTYNPMADSRLDDAAFDDETDPDIHGLGGRGGDNQPTGRNYRQEDMETAQSAEVGTIPRGTFSDDVNPGDQC